ncbi:hypothetical protein QFZ56_006397 [Streptomyces achromogenes]|uniref:Uncharacterized protein n=1 Tax=Streptomyces achromogenes TaxID=67255 RepID=A0ABU0QA01_STRAH|nr:hypothetical protein [Streptomyces achromogenes]
MLQTAGVEDERVVVVRHLGGRDVRARMEDGTAGGRGEGERAVVVHVADRVAVGAVGGAGGPLDRGGAQSLVRHSTQVVTGYRVVRLLDLLEDLLGAVVREAAFVTHGTGDGRDEAPVGRRLAGRVGGGAGEGEVALAVDEHALGLGPQRAGQDDVGVRVGLGVGEDVLRDDELRRLQAFDDRPAVGHGGDGVGADDPAGLDLAVGHLPEHLHGALADAVRPDRARRQTPQVLDEGPVGVDEDGALAGQPRPHVAHLAPAHGVGLAGEGEGAAARPADRAGGEVEVDERVGVPGAVRGLVEAHGPAAGPLPRLADRPGRLAQVGLRDAGDPRDGRGRVVGEEPGHRLPALGERGDELRVGVAVLVQQVQQSVEEGEVGARPDLEEQVGLRGGGGAPRVDDDQFRTRFHPFHHPQEEDGVAVGHVGADDEEDVRAVEVVVGAGRAVGAQRQLVTGPGACHAQPGVGLDLVGPQETLGEFVGQVLRFEAHLAGHVEGDRVRTVLVDDGPQPPCGLGDRRVHGGGLRLLAAVLSDEGGGEPAGRGEHVGGGRALGAQPSGVRRVPLVAGGLQHRTASVRPEAYVEDHAAADAAVRADRAHLRLGRAVGPRVRHGHGRPLPSDDRPGESLSKPLRRYEPCITQVSPRPATGS